MWSSLTEILAVVGDFGIVALAILVWRIKVNDLHNIEKQLASLTGRFVEHTRDHPYSGGG